MTTSQIGIRNSNIIVPYTATTKRTKELTVASFASATSKGTIASSPARIICYADSVGRWRLRFNLNIDLTGDTNLNSYVDFTIVGVTFAASATGSISVLIVNNSLVPQSGGGDARGSTNTIRVWTTATGQYIYMSGDVPLSAEPTTYTTAANMEGVLPVDVYIPPASVSVDGIVNTGVQSFSGVKTFTNGISLGNETLSVYDEGTWTPVLSYSTPGTSSFTYGEQYGYYVRVGRLVTCQIFVSLSGFSKGTASGFMSVSLPIATTSDTRCQAIGGFSSYNWTLPTCIQVGLEPTPNTLRATINGIQSGGGIVVVDGSTGQFQSTISYFV